MIKMILASLSLLCATANAASPKEPFTCEKIKDKPTRTWCIDTRSQALQEEAEKKSETELVAAVKTRDEVAAAKAEAEKLKEQSDVITRFVEASKQQVSKRFKDPDSARYSALQLFSNKTTGKRTLCGKVNAKNSFGGYVGAEYFHVTEEPDQRTVYLADEDARSKDLGVLLAGIEALKKHEALCNTKSTLHDIKAIEVASM